MQSMEDFNVPSVERVALLKRLQEAMGGAPPYFWAACQICDLQALGELIEFARTYPLAARIVAGQAHKMILHWSQRSKGSSRTSTPIRKPLDLGSDSTSSPSSAKRQKTTDSPRDDAASSPVLYRHKKAAEVAKQRDGCCVLTGMSDSQVAHIYPFYSLKTKEEDLFGARRTFWNMLGMFWSKEKVAAWEAELFPRGISEIGIETVCNLITLSSTAHIYWNRGAFALKPISVDNNNTTLKIQFFWQKKQNDTQATMSLLTTPFSTQNLDHNEGAFEIGATVLFNTTKDKRIKSGDIFELKTNDATARPLPSFKLLEIQWFLTRIVGIAGAAGPYEGWMSEDSDEEISTIGLEEAQDDSLGLSDFPLQDSPLSLHRSNLLPIDGLKRHTEVATRDELGEGGGGQEIM